MNKFPYLEISGTYSDIGHAIGETFSKKIRDVLSYTTATNSQFATFISLLDPYIRQTHDAFPELIEELEGVAKAANVPFNELFFHNVGSLTDPSVSLNREQSETADHCTIAVSWDTDGNPIIGHNEDWSAESIDELYVLKATVGGVTFLGLNYATFLPGVAASLNSYGLAQCINEVPQTRIAGVPKNFLARAVLQTTSLDEAQNLLKKTNRATGYNHLLVQNSSIRDIEVSRMGISVESIINVPYAHTNHFTARHLQKSELSTKNHYENSYARLERAREMLKIPMSVDDMKALLSDQTNPTYPICRPTKTIGSVIIEPMKNTMWICYGLPTTGTYLPYTL